jgi:hypothetical protein
MNYRRPLFGERQLIVDYLAENWRSDHLFALSPDWLDWQHLGSDGSAYHAVCAFDSSGSIVGFLGVMPLSQNADMLTTGIWIASRKSADRTIGLALFRALEQIYPARYIGSFGVNAAASAVLRMLGHRTGLSRSYYYPGPGISRRVLSSGLQPAPVAPSDGVSMTELGSLTECPPLSSTHLPQKPLAWYHWRYETGAPFRYRFFLFHRSGRPRLLAVARQMSANGGSCLRLVDFLGDIGAAGRFGPSLLPVLETEGHEYAELLAGGGDLSAFDRCGLLQKPEDAVIPAYFDPFVASDTSLGWTIKVKDADAALPAYIFRGDGDQDRPNRPGMMAPSYVGRPC